MVTNKTWDFKISLFLLFCRTRKIFSIAKDYRAFRKGLYNAETLKYIWLNNIKLLNVYYFWLIKMATLYCSTWMFPLLVTYNLGLFEKYFPSFCFILCIFSRALSIWWNVDRHQIHFFVHSGKMNKLFLFLLYIYKMIFWKKCKLYVLV